MRQAKRWGVLCLATVILHLGALNWAGQHLSRPEHPDLPRNPVQVRLRPAAPTPAPRLPDAPPPVAQATPHKPPAVRRPARKTSPHAIATVTATPPRPDATAIDAAPDSPASAPASASTETPAPPQTSVSNSGTAPLPAPPVAATPPPAPQPPPARPAKTYRINLPPSLEVKYAVSKGNLKEENGSKTEGSGTIRWINSGQQYRIEGAAKILFVTIFSFQSEGDITAAGITPLLYNQKDIRGRQTNTHFQRERNVISFSASTREFPRTEGAQDRASMLWQLAGIGRGSNEKISDNDVIEFVVASEREAELWQFRVLGLEYQNLGEGDLNTWHVQRAPPDGSYGSKFDVWLSPQHQWAPVRILQTDSNGTITEMKMTQFTLNNTPSR